jgi:hypothetical protein
VALSFDHLDLTDAERRLITRACGTSPVVYLAHLDKGLSGSGVWQARWQVQPGVPTKDHVFKIGPRQKLMRERKAIDEIVSAIEPGFPHVRYLEDEETDRSLLCQEFVGEIEGETISLRKYIQSCDGVEAGQIIQRLYLERMVHWHPLSRVYPQENITLAEALDWWVNRMDIAAAAEQVGTAGIESILVPKTGLNIARLNTVIRELLSHPITVPIGTIHGDLHAQNVLLGAGKNMQLIDFGWTNREKWKAIDFLMMECSLKFVASPPHALLSDLMKLDELLDSQVTGTAAGSYSELAGCVHGNALLAIAHAVHAVRHCALILGAATDFSHYRLGLITLMAGLTLAPFINQSRVSISEYRLSFS